MINTRTNQFEEALGKLIEQSQLPPVNVRLVLQAVASQMAMLEQQVMAQEQAAEQEEQIRKESEAAKASSPPPSQRTKVTANG